MPPANFSPLSFLIVDDVRTTRISLLGMLKDMGDPVVFHAENGHEALSMLQEKAKEVDCIISDFNMPVIHGLKMAQLIRMGYSGIRRDIPIVMLTGYGDRNLLGLALALDVNAFLVKPAAKDVLNDRIATMLNTLKAEERWIKPEEAYKWIDVDTAVKPLLEKPSVDLDQIDKQRIDKAISDQQKKEQIKKALKLEITQGGGIPDDAVMQPGIIIEPIADLSNCIKVPLDMIPKDSILANNIKDNKGKMLISAGMTLSKGMIDRLKDLQRLGFPIHEIWVKANPQK